jgi:hypothetical protein
MLFYSIEAQKYWLATIIFFFFSKNEMNLLPWTNLSKEDKTWAKFSGLEVAECIGLHLLSIVTITV